MPETQLKEAEWDTSQELLTFIVGDLWKTYIFGEEATLRHNELKAAIEALQIFTGENVSGNNYLSQWKTK